jgi:hypothetical protein
VQVQTNSIMMIAALIATTFLGFMVRSKECLFDVKTVLTWVKFHQELLLGHTNVLAKMQFFKALN